MNRINRRIVLLLYVTMLLIGTTFGYPEYSTNNTTNDTGNVTTPTETTIEPTVTDTITSPVETTVEAPIDIDTPIETSIPIKTPKSPGFEIIGAIMILSVIYIIGKKSR